MFTASQEDFDAVRRHPAYKAALARGAVELWLAGVEIIEGLKHASIMIVRNAPPSSAVHSTPGATEAMQ